MAEHEEHMVVVSGPHGAEPHLAGHYEWHCLCGESGGEYVSRSAARAEAMAHGEKAEAKI